MLLMNVALSKPHKASSTSQVLRPLNNAVGREYQRKHIAILFLSLVERERKLAISFLLIRVDEFPYSNGFFLFDRQKRRE